MHDSVFVTSSKRLRKKCILFASSYVVYHVSLLDYIVMRHAHIMRTQIDITLKIILLGQILRHTYMVIPWQCKYFSVMQTIANTVLISVYLHVMFDYATIYYWSVVKI